MAATKHANDLKKALTSFGDGVQHIHGNLFRVRRDLIQIAPPFDAEAATLTFGNPRWVKDTKGKLKAKGIMGSKDEQIQIESLRAALAKKGLQNPLSLRITESTDLEGLIESMLIVVDGERRFRSITQLCNENTDVYDQVDGRMKGAENVYEYIECRISVMEEDEALESAIIASETGVSVGDTAVLNVVSALRKLGYDKESIKRITGGKSETWWRESLAILDLDDETLTAFQNEEINRRVAIQLAKIQDVEERLERLGRTRDALAAHIEKKKEKLREAINRQEEEVAAAEETFEAESDDDDNATRLIEATDTLDEVTEKLTELENNPPPATEKHLNESAQAGEQVKPWSFSKIKKSWLVELPVLIHNNGCDIDGNDLNIDPEDARLAKTILEAIENAEKDDDGKSPVSIVKLLQSHATRKK